MVRATPWALVAACAAAVSGCGSDAPHLSGRGVGTAPIVSGTDIGPEDFPAVGGLLIKTETSAWMGSRLECTATLLSPRVIVTAAHCFDNREPTQPATQTRTFIYSGLADLERWESLVGGAPEDAATVSEFALHPGYDPELWENSTEVGVQRFDDIALGRLAEPACRAAYPALSDPGAPISGADVEIVGYGYGDAGQDVGVKRWAGSTVGQVGDWEMEIGSTDLPRRCSGDSGGPTFSEAGILLGVGSHSYGPGGCAGSSVDTRVDAYRDWIAGVLDNWGPDEPCPDPVEEGGEVPQGSRGCIQTSPVWPFSLLIPVIFWRRNRLRSD